MNLKNIFVILTILILIFSASAVFAESFSLKNTTFEVPQGYSINKTGDLSVRLVNNNDTESTIFVSVTNFTDTNASISSRQVSGFKFLAEENFFTDNNVSVNQQNYMKNETYYSYYSFEVNGTGYQIGYIFPVHGDSVQGDGNPVMKIIESI